MHSLALVSSGTRSTPTLQTDSINQERNKVHRYGASTISKPYLILQNYKGMQNLSLHLVSRVKSTKTQHY